MIGPYIRMCTSGVQSVYILRSRGVVLDGAASSRNWSLLQLACSLIDIEYDVHSRLQEMPISASSPAKLAR